MLWILFQLAISKKRVPAEWEKQEAVWFQWPSLDEDSYMSQPMSNVISVVSEYERVNILCSNQRSLVCFVLFLFLLIFWGGNISFFSFFFDLSF